MNQRHTRPRELAQAASPWCVTKHVDIVALLTLATVTDDIEWKTRAADELIRLPSSQRRRLLAGYADLIGSM